MVLTRGREPRSRPAAPRLPAPFPRRQVEPTPQRPYLGEVSRTTKPGLEDIADAARQAPGRGLPPVHLWNPARSGEIDIVIKRDGRWVHEGAPIAREALVRLFSTILRKDPDGVWLVTPVEKLRITVEDAPFVAVRMDRDGEALRFLTNVGDEVEAGPAHPIRVEVGADGEPRPYLHVRRGLEALIARPVFYELADMAETRATPQGDVLGVAAHGAWFALGPTEATVP